MAGANPGMASLLSSLGKGLSLDDPGLGKYSRRWGTFSSPRGRGGTSPGVVGFAHDIAKAEEVGSKGGAGQVSHSLQVEGHLQLDGEGRLS